MPRLSSLPFTSFLLCNNQIITRISVAYLNNNILSLVNCVNLIALQHCVVFWVQLSVALTTFSYIFQSPDPHICCILTIIYVRDLMVNYTSYLSFAGSLSGCVPQWNPFIHSTQCSDRDLNNQLHTLTKIRHHT